MNTTVDFTKLKRIPTSIDIEEAQKQLEIILPDIIQNQVVFFETNSHPKRIDYIINPSLSSKSGFIQLPYPEVLFMDTGLTEEIRQETAVKFYDFLFAIINAD